MYVQVTVEIDEIPTAVYTPPYLHLPSNNSQIESPAGFWFGEVLDGFFDSMAKGLQALTITGSTMWSPFWLVDIEWTS